jgi:hypothetical protein
MRRRRRCSATASRERCASVRSQKTQASSTAGFFARLGCTRIGSPGIFGLSITKALFRAVKAQVADERKWVGYRANLGSGFARHLFWRAVTKRS